jgi:hypothetical protein
MNTDPFLAFIALVEGDQKIAARATELENNKHIFKQLEHEVEERKMVIVQEQQRLHDLKKAIDSNELELKSLQSTQVDKNRHLQVATNPREYLALHTELEKIAEHRKQKEVTILDFFEVYELQQAKIKQLEISYHDWYAQVALRYEELKKHMTDVVQDLSIRIENRKQLLAVVPEEYLTRYERMRESVHNPVVPVENNACGGCFFPLTTHDIIDIRQRKIVTCKDCFRLLYKIS